MLPADPLRKNPPSLQTAPYRPRHTGPPDPVRQTGRDGKHRPDLLHPAPRAGIVAGLRTVFFCFRRKLFSRRTAGPGSRRPGVQVAHGFPDALHAGRLPGIEKNPRDEIRCGGRHGILFPRRRGVDVSGQRAGILRLRALHDGRALQGQSADAPGAIQLPYSHRRQLRQPGRDPVGTPGTDPAFEKEALVPGGVETAPHYAGRTGKG